MDKVTAEKMLSYVEKVAQNEELLDAAVDILRESAASLGILLRLPKQKDIFKVAPLTLFPTLAPQHAIDEIVQLQCDINLLMHRVAHDRPLLTTSLSGAASVDSFIQNLLEIYLQIDVDSQWELSLIRSDYILSQESSSKLMSYQQVEVNMMAVGMVGLGGKVGILHDRVRRFLDFEDESTVNSTCVSTGETLALYGEGLRLAYNCYRKHVKKERKRPPVLLIVIQDSPETIILDQRFVEFAAGVVTIRRSFGQIAETAYLDESGCLIVEGREVAVVYYRTGYSPNQYKNRDWEIRLLMEKSTAIKCPSVAHQLSGVKKIQQVLSRPDVLQRFIPEKDLASRMQRTFMGQWDISELESQAKLQEAIKESEKFVLKPNREGGGNNFYGPDLLTKIKEVQGTPKAQDFILMELIQPVVQENYFIRPDRSPERATTISEVSVFGVILAKNNEIALNKSAKEILVRAKASGSHEGAICTGHACYGSVVAVQTEA